MARSPALYETHRALVRNPLARFLLRPLAWLWQGVAAARRFLYRKNVLRVHRLSRPVISVGNLALGGAGKTPFVIFLAQYLVNHGANVAVVSRGYGRDVKGRVVVRRHPPGR